jgi:penicillin amidase
MTGHWRLALSLVLAIGVGAIYVAVRTTASESPAHPSTTLMVPGLKQAVEVYRDAKGTPHIFAANDDDLFLAHGYVTAEDRLFQID